MQEDEVSAKPETPRQTTIYDIARQVGLSASTVSAVLNGNWKSRRISEKTAERIRLVADRQGFALNQQARALRRQRSNLIGMIMPKYDNRYFSSIAEQFEHRARIRGLFPIITCTSRDPELELQAARTLLSYKVDCVIATGATNPDLISDICRASGVLNYNLDLPGSRAPSVISDNYGGALVLTSRVLAACAAEAGRPEPLAFIGGRSTDHNTLERLRAFRDAHAQAGIAPREDMILTTGYAAERAEQAVTQLAAAMPTLPAGIFVNSTSALEGVMRWLRTHHPEATIPHIGSFDWDPFAALIDSRILMARQDVETMLDILFDMMAERAQDRHCTEVPVRQIAAASED
ncbi:LacI family DNA-binding transcriptional regulator [Sinirhodobacter populi]|uniref:LacI family DNA-binding transcriptional regulator n=1 Tax=Paenirhodobacter populi TaxID=2306993 RepID=A0A443K6R2_9RHOB|nr:LacI family DNA-binding transcriptional regulator [Sinirhodobacter populi]